MHNSRFDIERRIIDLKDLHINLDLLGIVIHIDLLMDLHMFQDIKDILKRKSSMHRQHMFHLGTFKHIHLLYSLHIMKDTLDTF